MSAKPAKELSELGREVLERGGRLRFAVAGDSMSPALASGETAVVEPLRGELPRVGDVLLFAVDGGPPIVHRMVAGRRHGALLLLATKGDNARLWDPVVPETAVLGRVTAVERHCQTLPLPRRIPALPDRVRGWRTLLRHARAWRTEAN